MNKFTLEIELGNDAMKSDADIARALRQVANRLRENKYTKVVKGFGDVTRGIMDRNGNTVGLWTLK